MFRFVLFDFDGVLIDSAADIADAVNDMLRIFDYPTLPINQIASFIGHGAEHLLRQSFGIAPGVSLPEGAMALYLSRYLENCTSQTTLYPHVREGLIALSAAGMKMAIVTNKPYGITMEILRRLSIKHLFEIVVSPEMVRTPKPSPEALCCAMAQMGASPEKTIMVGDSWTDVVAGRNAGVATCAVGYGIGDSIELQKQNPNYTFADFKSLCNMLLQEY